MVVAAPNYATNIVTPRAIDADIELLDLRFEDGYRLDLDRLASMRKLEREQQRLDEQVDSRLRADSRRQRRRAARVIRDQPHR